MKLSLCRRGLAGLFVALLIVMGLTSSFLMVMSIDEANALKYHPCNCTVEITPVKPYLKVKCEIQVHYHWSSHPPAPCPTSS